MSYQVMERARIQPSPLNPRKHFDPDKLQDLAKSMGNGVGIIEPLVVRSRPDLNCYELVAGERRWRAAAIAGLDKVPVIVKELTDAQMLEIMVVENNQREDVSPLEEARGYRQLMALDKQAYKAGTIAEKIGRSEKYVWDRMKLLDLVPVAQQLLDAGRINAGIAIILARLEPKDQERALDDVGDGVFEDEFTLRNDDEDVPAEVVHPRRRGGSKVQGVARYAGLKARSVREFEAWVARHVRFNVVQAAAAAPLEYGDTAAAVETALARPGRGKKVVPITFEFVAPAMTRDPKERTYGSSAWKRADGKAGSKACPHSVLGVVVGGGHYGRSYGVCIARDKCEVHWKREMSESKAAARRRAAAPAAPKKAKGTGEQPWEKRERERKQAAKVWASLVPGLRDSVVVAVKAAKIGVLFDIITDTDADRYLSDTGGLKEATKLLSAKQDADSLLRVLALMCALHDIGDGKYYGNEDGFRPTAKRLGIDLDRLLKATVQTSAAVVKGKAKSKKAA